MPQNTLEIKRPQKAEYQFVCHYSDGEKLHQNYGTKDEKHFGHIDLDRLEVFELTNGKKSFKLNLKTGEFDLDGLKVKYDLGFRTDRTTGNLVHILPERYELVYFRRIRQDFAPSGVKISVRFCFGWRTKIDGKVYQRLVFIEPDGSLTFSNSK